MDMTRSAAFDTLRRVREEFAAARLAIGEVLIAWDASPSFVAAARGAGVTRDQLGRTARHLQITFILRLFAAFEGVLRHYWQYGMRRTTEPEMRRLLDSVAARRRMSDRDRDSAHEVRELRNEIIHEDVRNARLDLAQCAKALGRYISWLPNEW